MGFIWKKMLHTAHRLGGSGIIACPRLSASSSVYIDQPPTWERRWMGVNVCTSGEMLSDSSRCWPGHPSPCRRRCSIHIERQSAPSALCDSRKSSRACLPLSGTLLRCSCSSGYNLCAWVLAIANCAIKNPLARTLYGACPRMARGISLDVFF